MLRRCPGIVVPFRVSFADGIEIADELEGHFHSSKNSYDAKGWLAGPLSLATGSLRRWITTRLRPCCGTSGVTAGTSCRTSSDGPTGLACPKSRRQPGQKWRVMQHVRGQRLEGAFELRRGCRRSRPTRRWLRGTSSARSSQALGRRRRPGDHQSMSEMPPRRPYASGSPMSLVQARLARPGRMISRQFRRPSHGQRYLA